MYHQANSGPNAGTREQGSQLVRVLSMLVANYKIDIGPEAADQVGVGVEVSTRHIRIYFVSNCHVYLAPAMSLVLLGLPASCRRMQLVMLVANSFQYCKHYYKRIKVL